MSWAYGVIPDGKEIGYGVLATCEEPYCSAAIDRGLSYVCGAMHEGGEHGCGGYFCPRHLVHGVNGDDEVSPQLCARCAEKWEAA